MSKPVIEDRAIRVLQTVKRKAIDLICNIDEELKYLDKVKKVQKKK